MDGLFDVKDDLCQKRGAWKKDIVLTLYYPKKLKGKLFKGYNAIRK